MLSLFEVLGPLLMPLLDKLIPDQAARDAAKAELAARLQQTDAQVTMAQLGVNAEEAKSASLFVSGWRPAVGWVCVVGLAYVFVLLPFLAWFCSMAEVYPPPSLDPSELMTLVTGMLGLAGIRSYDKRGPRALFPGK